MAEIKLSPRDKLLEQQRQLAARIAALDAREKSQERKDDTRRKILIGGAINATIKRGKFSEEQLMSILDRELYSPRDRAMFDLPPRTDGKTQPPKSVEADQDEGEPS